MKARLSHARSIVAASVLLVGALPVTTHAQATRTPNPNAPRLVVGTFRSNDKKLSVSASEEMRSRLNSDIPFRALTVLSSADYKTVVEQSGYPYDEALSSGDLNSLAKLLRTDEYMEGSIEKTATGFKLSAVLVLTRDAALQQPLPDVEGDKINRVASLMSKNVQDARKQMEFEKKCNMLGRDGKQAEALAAARLGVAAYPQATLVRLCDLQVRVGFKQPPDSIIASALEVIKYDPRSKVALTNAAQAYKDKGDMAKATDLLIQLLATDPTNRRLIVDVVNGLAASGQFDKAKPIIAQAVKDNPGDMELLEKGFQVYLAGGDYKAGTALGEEMVKIDSAKADTAFFLRMIGAYDSDSAYSKAAEMAARGAAKFPANTTLLGMLGGAQLKAGQQQQAIGTFRRLLGIDPKAPGVRLMLARTYSDMDQPDSALVMLREAKATGEDAQSVGGYALTFGKKLFDSAQKLSSKAQESKVSDDWRASITAQQAAIPLVAFADSSLAAGEIKNQAKFILGVGSFQIAYAAFSEAQKGKSCDMAKLAADNIMTAQMNLPAGGRAFPQIVAQLMPAVAPIMTGADQMVKQYCK
ncbi:MAG: tetratricopeptide repeat protein [Gemmatimonadaceae bacterium]